MLNSAGRGAGRRVALIVVTCLALLAPGTASAQADEGRPVSGHVYVLDNNLTGSNSITVFNRARDGHLSQAETTNVGGLGSVVAVADGTEGWLVLSPNGRRLVAVESHEPFLYVLDSRLLLTPPRPATLTGPRIGSGGHLTSVVDPSAITRPPSAIGLAAD
jgi:hypothetical protein